MSEEEKDIALKNLIEEQENLTLFRKILVSGINNTSRVYKCQEHDKLVCVINQFSLDEDDCIIASAETNAIISDDTNYTIATYMDSEIEYDHYTGLEKGGHFGDKMMPKRFVIYVDAYLPAQVLVLCKEKDIVDKNFKACGVIFGYNSLNNLANGFTS